MKVKRIVTIIFTVLAVLMTVMSGTMKLMGNPDVTTMLTSMGVTKFVTVLGILQITFTALFAYPPTLRIGFILLSCYYSGALAVEIFHDAEIHAILPMGLIWVAAFLRDGDIFWQRSSGVRDSGASL